MKQLINILFFTATVCGIYSCKQNQIKQEQQAVIDSVKNIIQSDTLDYQKTPIKLKDLVSKIETINEVQSAHIGAAGVDSENYKNFISLKKNASIQDLIELTDNKNGVVACYSAMALADTSYPDLKTIFSKFIHTDRTVMTFTGCTKMEDRISNELYHQYWNSVSNTNKATDKMLIEFDSIILFSNSVYWLLRTRAIENRVYSEPFKSQIAHLAFVKANPDAIYYLCNWHKAEYADQLKIALLKYLKVTKFSNVGTTGYYKTIEQLFLFKDEKIKKEIIAKMKSDRHWEAEKERFKYILEDNGIYDIDSE
jgi:hypothetical protein